MDCKSVEKLIPKFLRGECSQKEEEMILAHIRECVDCKEELTIEFLLSEGLNRLEEGESFDLNAELEKRLQEKGQSKKKKRHMITAEAAAIIWDVIGGVVITGVIIGLLLWNIL